MSDPFASASLPIVEPKTVVVGRFVAWRKLSLVDPIMSSLAYKVGTQTINGIPSSDGYWRFEMTSVVTAAMTATANAPWSLVAIRESDGEEMELARGVWDVVAADADRRTHAEITLEKIEAVIEGRADDDVSNYTIAGRSVGKMSPDELIRWREHYQAEVARERAAMSGINHRSVRVVIR